jgi:hypothetical protein
VAEASLFSRDEARFLKELLREKVDFMVIGLAAAALQGAPIVTQDIDLWFRDLPNPKLEKALKKVGGAYVPPFDLNPPMLAGEAVKLFDIVLTVHGLNSFQKEKKHIVWIPIYGTKVPVLNLDRIILSKKTANRKKDRLVVPVLEDCLRTLQIQKKNE